MAEYIKSLRKFVGHAPLLHCGATAIVIDEHFRVLMMHRTDNDCWCFPGGAVELGEDVRETAAREAYEETGLVVSGLRLLDVFSGQELHYTYPNEDEVYSIDIVFYTNIFSGELIENNEESKECLFFEIGSLPDKIMPTVVPVARRLVESFDAIKRILRKDRQDRTQNDK